ncbi:WLM-domain-containing protein [Punctularia strigosozonata HHB-11173 SS5]|uniref:WLM-domain-containing protein n=1 Tax=Punctularia strigosozonata (strain HHB-11173) TaxID=741275 RepID=UPI00044177D7|nr:WLM-domain-containing protein [Punctularia strigosozonata HHB-11173 SS5]EIN14418.1 WLM-domain-containing protein [Punctularia strigosozonata HHB-11173 SS5]
MSETFVASFTHLKDRPRADRALEQLKRLASLVKPIMRKHGWKLPVLSEFFPDNPSLLGLNVNAGQKILVRLRPASAPDTFYDEDDLVHTLLHELTHNVHGPHDDKFYKFLAELEGEYDALKRSGYAGEGFYSLGHRLGVNTSHNLPPHLARQKAVEAAERRARIGGMMSGARRLGGGDLTAVRRGMSPRELAAEAAERRARDAVSCGQGSLAQQEAEKAAKESAATDADIDLTVEDDDDIVILDGPASTPSSSKIAARRPTASATSAAGGSTSASRNSGPGTLDGEWACPTCTLLNPPASSQCTACLSPRPKPRAVIGSGWNCPSCTFENTSGATRCVMCDSPPFAGAPRATRPVRSRGDPAKPKTTQSRVPPEDERKWSCLVCGESDMPHELWSCRFCGTVKFSS